MYSLFRCPSPTNKIDGHVSSRFHILLIYSRLIHLMPACRQLGEARRALRPGYSQYLIGTADTPSGFVASPVNLYSCRGAEKSQTLTISTSGRSPEACRAATPPRALKLSLITHTVWSSPVVLVQPRSSRPAMSSATLYYVSKQSASQNARIATSSTLPL